MLMLVFYFQKPFKIVTVDSRSLKIHLGLKLTPASALVANQESFLEVLVVWARIKWPLISCLTFQYCFWCDACAKKCIFHGTNKLVQMVSHDFRHRIKKLFSMGFEILGLDGTLSVDIMCSDDYNILKWWLYLLAGGMCGCAVNTSNSGSQSGGPG